MLPGQNEGMFVDSGWGVAGTTQNACPNQLQSNAENRILVGQMAVSNPGYALGSFLPRLLSGVERQLRRKWRGSRRSVDWEEFASGRRTSPSGRRWWSWSGRPSPSPAASMPRSEPFVQLQTHTQYLGADRSDTQVISTPSIGDPVPPTSHPTARRRLSPSLQRRLMNALSTRALPCGTWNPPPPF